MARGLFRSCCRQDAARTVVCIMVSIAAWSGGVKHAWVQAPLPHDECCHGHFFRQPVHWSASRSSLVAGRFFGEVLPVRSDRSKLAMSQLRRGRTVMHQFAGMTATQDALLTSLFGFALPLIVGVVLVYIVIIFKPDAIYSSSQMVEFNRLEKERELKRRGAIKLDDEPLSRGARRKRTREKLRGKAKNDAP
mmetsp:Transcript_106500/g.206250  ORF Transcript_106500/g.206250 Transcript_106500/m.206250 type:complete len:192 (-) Transcript_106500:261-836(-)